MSKVLQDITKEVIQYAEEYHYLPDNVKIAKAEILTDEWESKYLYVEYIMDGEQHNIVMYYVNSLEGILIITLEKIKDYYNKLHTIQN